MGTNRFANQAGMTGFGMPRHNISKYTDDVRGQQPHDESTVSRQTSGWKEGECFDDDILFFTQKRERARKQTCTRFLRLCDA